MQTAQCLDIDSYMCTIFHSTWQITHFLVRIFGIYINCTSTGGGFAAPRIRNVEHGGLVAISGRSPRLLLCILIWCCCISAAVYLSLCICSCVSAAVYLPLCLLCCISTTVSATVHLPLCICRSVSAAVYIVLCILNYFCISAAVYPTLVSAAVYPTLLFVAIYPTLVSAAVYLPLCILRCVSAAGYLPLCICHCVCCIVESYRVQRERWNYLLYKSDYLPNHLTVESMPLYT